MQREVKLPQLLTDLTISHPPFASDQESQHPCYQVLSHKQLFSRWTAITAGSKFTLRSLPFLVLQPQGSAFLFSSMILFEQATEKTVCRASGLECPLAHRAYSLLSLKKTEKKLPGYMFLWGFFRKLTQRLLYLKPYPYKLCLGETQSFHLSI